MNNPLNIILYGPPGTGKTYETINKAIEIIDFKYYEKYSKNREFLLKKFKKLQDNKVGEQQIEFVTFHQSYGYEEFVEGVRAVPENGDMTYSIVSGVFKKISERAKENLKNSNPNSISEDFDVAYDKFTKEIKEKTYFFLETKIGKKFAFSINDNQGLVLYTGKNFRKESISKKSIIQLLDGENPFNDWNSYFIPLKKYLEKYDYPAEEVYDKFIEELREKQVSFQFKTEPQNKVFAISLVKDNLIRIHTGDDFSKTSNTINKINLFNEINGEKSKGSRSYYPIIVKYLKEKHLNKDIATIDTNKLIKEFANYVEELGKLEIRKNVFIEVKYINENVSFKTSGKVDGQSLSEKIIKRDYEDFYNGVINKYQDIKPTNPSMSEYHGNASNYFSLYEKLKEFHESIDTYIVKDTTLKNYVLIIDEINRGNISKIFGELITLIEPSKRLGNEEALSLHLPYSGNNFEVPKNLYIIGTMNTSDRSIALMDTALRRRFNFIEMIPKPEKLKNNFGVDLKEMLTKINKRIEYLYDREHTIGHSFFINLKTIDDLNDVFKNKIIPLLQEYFYDDWEKIKLVLNDNGFITEKNLEFRNLFEFNNDYDYETKKSYSVNEEAFEKENYVLIYKTKDNSPKS